MDSLELFSLAQEYYRVASGAKKKVQNGGQLRELYTLLKMCVVCLNKILMQKNAVNSYLRANCLFMKSEIIANYNMVEYDENGDLVRPEFLLDQARLISSSHESLINLKLEAEFRLVQLLWRKNKNYKFALKFISESIFAQTSLFKFLNCLILIEIDPCKALNFLQFLISQNQINDNDPEIINLFMLMESNLSLSLNLTSIVNLDLIQTNFTPFILFRSWLDIIVQLNLKQPMVQNNEIVDVLQIKLKAFAELLSNSKNLLESFTLNFNCFQNFLIPLEIKWLDYNSLFSTFLIVFAVSNLNSSFEKRKSLQLLNKNLLSIDESLKNFNEFNIHLNESNLNLLKNIKSQTFFYKLIELSMTTGFNDDAEFNQLISEIQDEYQVLYLNAIKDQLNNKLNEAKMKYHQLISLMKQKTQTYNELFILSNLNYLLIVESELNFKIRNQQRTSELISHLTFEKNQILTDLKSVEAIKTSLNQHKFLIKSSIEFIYLLNNYNNYSTLQINEQVSHLLDPLFEYFKNYPLFASMLLYLKSSTLNDNSDQKQKSSQLAFNLSKFGNQLLIRYVTGLLNQSNSHIAKNYQQFDIQTSKNVKIEQQILDKYGNFYES